MSNYNIIFNDSFNNFRQIEEVISQKIQEVNSINNVLANQMSQLLQIQDTKENTEALLFELVEFKRAEFAKRNSIKTKIFNIVNKIAAISTANEAIKLLLNSTTRMIRSYLEL